ncbi:MAG: hypothetical protein EBX41_05025, partial [Chitinophagia bacterium]|nr:hypothetical protein [Chitinophagia bacterium]
MKRIIFFILLLSAFAHNLYASHIVGGDVTYKYIGSSGSSSVYEITIIIYQDCQNGQPSAIQDDYPVYLAIYDAATK